MVLVYHEQDFQVKFDHPVITKVSTSCSDYLPEVKLGFHALFEEMHSQISHARRTQRLHRARDEEKVCGNTIVKT